MKKIQAVLPLAVFVGLTVAYKVFSMGILEGLLGYDVTLYMDGREVYGFGIGSCSQLFILVSFIAVMIWTWKTAGKLPKGKKQLYLGLMGIGNTLLYVFWARYYWQWYTVGVYYWWLYY